jgi:ribosomal protein S27E
MDSNNTIKIICSKCGTIVNETVPENFNESQETVYCDNCKETVNFFVEHIEKQKQLLKD